MYSDFPMSLHICLPHPEEHFRVTVKASSTLIRPRFPSFQYICVNKSAQDVLEKTFIVDVAIPNEVKTLTVKPHDLEC